MLPEDQDVPSPIDLRRPADADQWVAAADVTRPWRAELRTAIAELLRRDAARPLRVLELGPGPGLLAEAIIASCAIASYTLFDFPAPMLEMCKHRLRDHPAVNYVRGDFTREDWPQGLQPPFDVIVAMQAIHEVRHKRHVPRLYAQARDLLRPGGMLVVCDHTPPDDSARYRALHSTVLEQHAALGAARFADIVTHLELRGLYLCSGTCPPADG